MESRDLVWTREAVPAFLQSCRSGCHHITHIRGEITDRSAHCREGWEELGCSNELPARSSTGLSRSPRCSRLLLRGLPPGHPTHFSVTHAICGVRTTGTRTRYKHRSWRGRLLCRERKCPESCQALVGCVSSPTLVWGLQTFVVP